MKRRDAASPRGRVALVATLKKSRNPEDEEETAEEERVGAEKGKDVCLGQLEVHSVQELVPERREAVGEDGVNENRPRREGVERSVF